MRTELHKALSDGLLDLDAPVDLEAAADAQRPLLAIPGDSAPPDAGSAHALRRVHTSTPSPLACHVQDGRDLAFHLAEDIPASRRVTLRAALESRGWRVEYNIAATVRLRQRGVIVLPDRVVHTRGTRVIELEEAGAHVASIEQLLTLLNHPAGGHDKRPHDQRG